MGWASYREDIVSRAAGAAPLSSQSQSAVAGGGSSQRRSSGPKRVSVKAILGEGKMEKSKRTPTGQTVNKLAEFTATTARPLPVILLADISGSMEADGKIQALNRAAREMLETLQDESELRAEIHLAIITFGGEARTHLPLGVARDAKWTDVGASGGTPMGAAFDLARELVEDRNAIPSRAYRPTIVLVSDGQPTPPGTEKAPLKRLLESERGGKAFRMALAIGADADQDVLKAFVNNPEQRVYCADDARQIRSFFKLATMSVLSRSRSPNPNSAPVLPNEGWDP